MARPDIEVHAPVALFVGRDMWIAIHVTAHKETKVDFIEATLLGDQGWTVGSGKNQITERLKWPQLGVQLMGPGVLTAGEKHELRARFVLPDGTPPTHEIGVAWSRMRLKVHVSIPWALDARPKYDFAVRIPPPPQVVRTPVMLRSTDDPGKPRIEVGLASTTLIAGEELVGTVALYGLSDDKPREVELTLIPGLYLLRRGRTREREGRHFGWNLTIPAGGAGKNVPFKLALPEDIVPSFKAASHELNWWLVARTGGFFSGGKVETRVFLNVVDRDALVSTPRLTAAPRIGDARIGAVVEQFARAHGWTPVTDEAADFAIEKHVDAATLKIAYAYRGPAGAFVDASVHTPGLGLALAVAPSGLARHVFWRDVEVDIAEWDRANNVAARFPAQAIPFLQQVVPALMKVERLGTHIRWSDTECVFERQVADVTDEDLGIAASLLEYLARAIQAALPAIAPPPGLAADAGAWKALAEWLGGTFMPGDLSVHGALDGARVDLGLTWRETTPVAVHVAVGDPDAAGEELRQITITLPRPAADVLAANAAERLVELVTRWPAEWSMLEVHDGVASAHLLLGQVADAQQVRKLVEALRAVLVALAPGSGPYR